MRGGPGGGGPGGGGMGKGPELSKIGAKQNSDWIVKHVRNPKAHSPQSKMPPFDSNKINDADLKSLGDFLASLK